MEPSRVYLVGFLVLIAGLAIILVGSAGGTNSSVGGVVFIGPIPIVFGSGPNSGFLAILAVAISATMILFYFLSYVRRKSVVSNA